MAQDNENVKQEEDGPIDRFNKWLQCHPKTIAYIAFFLALNYVIDFLPKLF